MGFQAEANYPAPCPFRRRARSEAPFLHQRYPVSTVLRTPPPPHTARPVPRGSPVESHTLPPLGLSVLLVVSSSTHAVATTPVGPVGCCRSSRPTGGGLPCYSGRSAPTLPFSRPARRSLTLRPACSLSHQVTLFLKCFSPIRYLLEPLQVLPAGATRCRVGFAPTRINKPFTAH